MGSSVTKAELYAERSSLIAMLDEIPSGDFLGRVGLEAKLKAVESRLEALRDVPETLAETFLYLGGKLVDGSRGIDANLASDILKRYQAYVSAVHASRTQKEPLAEAGPIPSVDSSALQLVGTPRGSFGFALREKADQARLTESLLHESVEVANELIASSAKESEEDFESAISDEPARVIKELSNFLKTLERYEASIRLVSSKTNVDIPTDKITTASSRTENIEISEKEEGMHGVFLGARKNSRDFNFQPDGEGPISGKLGKDIEDHNVTLMNREYQDKRCKAVFVRTETKRKESGKTTIRWTLKDIYLEDSSS